MLRRETLCAVLAFNCSLAASAMAQNRPNLIFILTDDQGVESIEGPYWSNEMECYTPTLSALAQQGVSFTNCRVNPNCSPTRAALMTGRLACETGVNGVLGRYTGGENPCTGVELTGVGAQVTNRLGLQTHEKTIADVLHDLETKGYYTILIDKWHLGYNEDDEDLGLLPTQQGSDEFYDWMERVEPGDVPRICLDNPLQIGDEHMVRMYNLAVQAVTNRPDPENTLYALFYHTITPHRRHGDEDPNYPLTDGFNWWRVNETLCPYTYALWGYDPGHPNANDQEGNRRRFIQNVEAIDSVIRNLLIDLGVIGEDANRTYISDSDTIVFFTVDNGTDGLISLYGNDRGKNSTYEGGIKVPMFVMGEGIPGNTQSPLEDTRLINHVDFYDTICDIVEAGASDRDNEYGDFPRRGISFADAIGYGSAVDPREFSLSSYGNKDASNNDIWRVALVWDDYKLVCNSGGADFDDTLADEFYDLANDPTESTDLLNTELNVDQATAYLYMRDRIVDRWPTAVSHASSARIEEFIVEHYAQFSPTIIYVLVTHLRNDNGEITYEYEEFFDHYN